ncbi:chemotaxis protein CheW [Vibrio sp. YMD68]|uniref:chemotaxis protein CheW n=1 Tax=Vibrio sp. YMD68 TaxID=3042300 RepID=UPI00249A0684|nr:chemotaxis protein CheW [Vibrio sp. YMD68]WGW01581.1 chemotaxis protein CheW [Vibrio sp. YMD68]
MSENITETPHYDKYLEFKLGASLFAYPISKIKEIMEYPQVEPISGAPHYINGAMNLRGQLLPIFELSLCLGKETMKPGPKTCVVVTELEHQGIKYTVGNKVDLVTQVIEIDASALEVIPDLAGSLSNPMIKGLAKLETRLLTILDVDKLLNRGQEEWLIQQRTENTSNVTQSEEPL